MGNNNNKKNPAKAVNTQPKGKADTVVKEAKKRNGTEIFLIVFAIIAVVGIVASIIIGAISSKNKNKTIDYLNDDLSKYVTISDDYKKFTVDVTTDPIEDIDIEHEILKAL